MKQFFIIVLIVGVVQANSVNFIINGLIVPEGNTPWHVHLMIRTSPNSSDVRIGSGVIITLRHVLTVAQNVDGFSHWTIGVGSVDRLSLRLLVTTLFIKHPGYNPQTLRDNIAILALPLGQIISGSNASPILLPIVEDMTTNIENREGFFTGFGFTQNNGPFALRLKGGFQRVISQENCLNAYPHLRTFIDDYFCGSYITSNICGGDQGTAFVVNLNFRSTLVGLASFTEVPCVVDGIGGYVRVSQYMDWIRTITSQI